MGYESSPVAGCFKLSITFLLLFLLTVPAARAEGTYAGIGYAKAESEDIDTGNLTLIVGSAPQKGFGGEVFFSVTIDEDNISAGPIEADITIDTYGILGYYTTGADDFNSYFKFKAGFAVVDLEFDFRDLGSVDDDTSGFAYGFSFGAQAGPGTLEFTYLILPEFDDFQGIEVDAEVDLLGISYHWNID